MFRKKLATVQPYLDGIAAARGKYTIMGDADDSYDFSNLQGFLDKLRQGVDLVMGNRFKGGIAPGAMPPLHRYLGNPVLSWIRSSIFPYKYWGFPLWFARVQY